MLEPHPQFVGAHVFKVTFKHLPQLLRSHIGSLETLGQLLKIPPFPPKKLHSVGEGGDGIAVCLHTILVIFMSRQIIEFAFVQI